MTCQSRLNPILLKRMGEEDVLSETYVNAAKRLDYFAAHDEVPIYYKLRTFKTGWRSLPSGDALPFQPRGGLRPVALTNSA